MRAIFLVFCVALAAACGGTAANNSKNVNARTPLQPLPVYGYEVVKAYPHDPQAFTEGLFFHDGSLYESTGEEGRSSLRKIDMATGKILQKWTNPAEDFGEGCVLVGDKIYQFTWRQNLGRVFDAATLKPLREFHYQGEGWGATTDGTNIYLTQSTHVIKVMNPETFETVKTIPVMREDGKPLMQINELEWIKGEIWANVWHSEEPAILGKPNYIARIDPASGKLLGWIDLAGISPGDQDGELQGENTLNGIAYDAANDRIFVTGKQWKRIYEIKLTGPKNQ